MSGIRDEYAYSMAQVTKYWRFLLFAPEDVEQVVRMSMLSGDVGTRIGNNRLNRELYRLARDLGFRKRHMDEGPNDLGFWWERKTVSFEDVAGIYKRI